MNPVVLDGATLTPEAVARVARLGAPVELSAEARGRNDAARGAVAALLARGDELYGVSTGVGPCAFSRSRPGIARSTRSTCCAAMPAARAGHCQSAALVAARVSTLLDTSLTGLPPFLARNPGAESGALVLEYTAHSARPLHPDVEAARQLLERWGQRQWTTSLVRDSRCGRCDPLGAQNPRPSERAR